MPQLELIPNVCPKCSAEFAAQRTYYNRQYLRYQRENFAQRSEIKALMFQLQSAMQTVFDADSRYAELQHQWQKMIDAERVKVLKCTPA